MHIQAEMGIWTDPDSGHKITGAGVLIVEEYIKPNSSKVPCILIANNRASQTLSDFGGSYSAYHGEISKTASMELLEESCGLIDIDQSIIANQVHFDILASTKSNTFYRVYIIKAKGIASKYYDLNRDRLNTLGAKKQWLETESIHHVTLDSIDFDGLLDRKSVYFTDVHGITLKVKMRLRKVLATGREVINDVLGGDDLIDKQNLEVVNSGFRKGLHVFSLPKD